MRVLRRVLGVCLLLGGGVLFIRWWQTLRPRLVPASEASPRGGLQTHATSSSHGTAPTSNGNAQDESAVASSQATTPTTVMAYCARCRTKRPVTDVVYETTPAGRLRLKGRCQVCGGKVSQFAKRPS